MLSQNEMNWIRGTHGFWRKPTSWDEVGTAIPPALLAKMKVYSAEELGIEMNLSRDFTFMPPEPVFLVNRRDSLYLVNTEGSNYARYIKLVGSAM